jgi:thiamine pyrophosphate-dependent acetolactate synthase large subunit-like protein
VPEDRTAADRILEAAGEAGIGTVFGLPGVHNLAFWRSDGADRIVGVRQEQTAVYAADAYARATGGPGLALTTTGPGAANAVAAFGEAAASKSPVVLVASEVPAALARPGEMRGLLHESRDQAGIFEPLAKAVFRPRTVDEVADAAQEALSTALAWPRGPVYLDVPADVLGSATPPIGFVPPVRLPPDPGQVAQAARVLADAAKVVIWAGGGVVQSDATEALAAVAEALRAPVVCTYAARGALPASHPLAVGLPPHEPEIAELVASADVLLAVGTDFDGMTTRNWQMPRPPALVAINCAERDLSRAYEPDVAVHADARLALEALAGCEIGGERPAPNEDLQGRQAAVWRRLRADGRNATAMTFVDAIDAALPAEALLLCDMAVAGYWAGGYARLQRPRALQYPVGWGTLGYAIPAAVGAAATGRPALAVCGDGGAVMGIGELATLAQEGLPATVLVVVDGGYGMLRYDQDRAGAPHRGVDLTAPDFVAVAQAFGVEAERVTASGLADALGRSLASGAPRLLELHAAMVPPRTTSPRWFDPVDG